VNTKRTVPVILCLTALCLAAIAGGSAAADEEEKPDNRSIRWEGHRAARERSGAELKPLLVYFTNDSDKLCTKMRLETLNDRQVIRYLNEHFAACRMRPEDHPAEARKYGVDSVPSLWFVAPDGEKLTRVGGFLSPERLMPLLEYIVEGAYETTDYETWLEHRK